MTLAAWWLNVRDFGQLTYYFGRANQRRRAPSIKPPPLSTVVLKRPTFKWNLIATMPREGGTVAGAVIEAWFVAHRSTLEEAPAD